MYTPYSQHVEADAEAGRGDALDLMVTREMLIMMPVDVELEATFMETFGRWLRGWEARL
jgi:hypothetical protein